VAFHADGKQTCSRLLKSRQTPNKSKRLVWREKDYENNTEDIFSHRNGLQNYVKLLCAKPLIFGYHKTSENYQHHHSLLQSLTPEEGQNRMNSVAQAPLNTINECSFYRQENMTLLYFVYEI
jgi:hypothetical protein